MSKPFMEITANANKGLSEFSSGVLNAYRKTIRGLVDAMNLAGEQGAEDAKLFYSWSDQDLSDLSVTVNKAEYSGQNDISMTINASAQRIVFAEFGAGATAASQKGMTSIPPYILSNARAEGIVARSGYWSANYGTGELAKSNAQIKGGGLWHYKGELYDRVVPVAAMSQAEIMIRQELPRMVRSIGK